MTIHQLHISGFKSIHAETIELGRVNGCIGANGVGKSNMLEALGVLGAAANGVVDDEALLRRGVRAGLPRWFKSTFASARPPAHIGMGAEAGPESPRLPDGRSVAQVRRWLSTFGRPQRWHGPACGQPSRPRRAAFAPHG